MSIRGDAAAPRGGCERTRSTSFGPISATGTTYSTATLVIAPRGMPANSASFGSCTIVIPPRCLICQRPAASSVAEGSGEEHADHAAAVRQSRAPKLHIDAGTKMILERAPLQSNKAVGDQHMAIGRRHVDVTRLDRLLVVRRVDRKRRPGREDVGSPPGRNGSGSRCSAMKVDAAKSAGNARNVAVVA